MFADLTLKRPEHVPQGFCLWGGSLWIAQANTTTGDAWVSRYDQCGDCARWNWVDEMLVYQCHGWPLLVNDSPGWTQIGVAITPGADTFYWFSWAPGHSVSSTNGYKVAKIPIPDGKPGGWGRVTGNGIDKFYKDATLLFSRPSLSYVQGEIVVDDILMTLQAGPTYTGNPYPSGVYPRIVYTTAAGVIVDKMDVDPSIGTDPDTGQPIGGRKEHEGLVRQGDKLLIGTAVNYKPNYRYQITEL